MYCSSIEVLKDQIIGLVPVYTPRGDATELFTNTGLIHSDRRSFHTVKKALARSYAIDLRAQARILQQHLERKNLLPIYVDRWRVFIPVKVRQARVKNDSAYGYIDWQYIKAIHNQEAGTCLVKLSNGINLAACCSRAAIIQNLHMGRLVSEWLAAQRGQEGSQDRMLFEAMRILAGTLDSVQKRHEPLGKRDTV